jgi:MGT family glycosyltransferase
MRSKKNTTIAFFPEASYGAALNCVGIAQELRRRGAEPVFICHGGFRGVFAQYGFPEYAVPSASDAAGDSPMEWNAFIQRHRSAFRASPLAQLEAYVAPTWNAIVDTAIGAEAALQELIARLDPAVIVLDNVVMFPAILSSGRPWVRVISCAETELPDADVPPHLSGCSSTDKSGWAAFDAAYAEAVAPAHERFNGLLARCGVEPYAGTQFLEPSPHLNLLLAPEIVRYKRRAPLDPDRFVFLEGCVRSEGPYAPPPFAAHDRAPLVYTSFGSLGAIDTDMIGDLIAAFGRLPYRFLVNVGAWRDAYRLVPDNVYLSDWFPQPSVVRKCDLFIHHGGNNSFCEAIVFGVPSLILPYCWDGHDNATRCQETGVGRRLERYTWTEEGLRQAIGDLLEGKEMQARLKDYSRSIASSPGSQLAAARILTLL